MCAVPLQFTTAFRAIMPHYTHARTTARRAWRTWPVARRSGLLPGTPLVLRMGGALGTKPLDNDCLVARHTPTLGNYTTAPHTHLLIMIRTHLIPPILAQPPITWLPGNSVQRLRYGCCVLVAFLPLLYEVWRSFLSVCRRILKIPILDEQ